MSSPLQATAPKARCKSLRPYQARLVTDACRASGDVLVEQTTGSGKTLQIVTLVAMHLGRRFTHAVISAPQEQIEHGFVHRDYQRVDWSRHNGVAVPSVAVPDDIILAARKSDLGAVKQIRSYVRLPGPLDHALACTHAALNYLSADDLPANLSGKALFIDEAHHASADGLSQIVSIWRERGGQLFFFTATPYRGDGRPVALERMRVFRRSLAEHMAEGFAPGELNSEIVALGKPGDIITAGQFTGEDAPPPSYFDSLVAAICRKWLDDGRPKAIVRVPPMRGGSQGLVGRLIQALTDKGARVLNATGTLAKDKQRFLAALESEKNQNFAKSKYDIVVGIQRVMEGTDWPVCSAVYCVGMPGSLNTVVQLLGRAMRPKDKRYPAAHRNQARLVFFVPCGGGSALADLSLDHSRHALLTCCFLADHEVGQEWIVLREVRRGIEEALGPRNQNPAAADAENEANEALDPEVRAEIEFAMAAAREQITIAGGEPTLGEIVKLAAKTRPDLPETALHRVAAEILAAQPGMAGAKAQEAIHNEVAMRLRIDPTVKKAMEAAFTVVLDEFRAVTLKYSGVLESVRRQVHGVTGGEMRDFARRLRDAAPRQLTEDEILTWADAHHQASGTWPNINTGPIEGIDGETWKNVDNVLRSGLRGIQRKSSLAKLLNAHRGVRNNHGLPPLLPEQILAWADAHFDNSGQWPIESSGPIDGAPGESWLNVSQALRLGLRQLPKGLSLAKLLAEHRAVPNKGDVPQLSEALILVWADAYHELAAKWPTKASGCIANTIGESWATIDNALHMGLRGLPGKSSLAQLLAKQRGKRNHLDLAKLTIEQILQWSDAFCERTGHWPKVDSGPIVECPSETWLGVGMALSKGGRGLPARTSLAKLLAKHRCVRNHLGLPSLQVEQILAWADAFQCRTGRWPSIASGDIEDSGGEKWANINQSLQKGLRGLPGGSSLAKLLSERRGVPSLADVPLLSVEQILAWADAHYARSGDWPKVKLGLIDDAPIGITWATVDNALRQGARGLTGGSSLAQLLAESRQARNPKDVPRLTVQQILVWADAFYKCHRSWPQPSSGAIDGEPLEKWANVNAALRIGLRGLPGGSSLRKLLTEQRP